MDKVHIENNHLYLEYSYFDVNAFSYRDTREIIPMDEIGKLEKFIGPKGGLRSWYIYSKKKLQKTISDTLDRFETLTSFSNKHRSLCEEVERLFVENNIEIIETIRN